MSISKQPTHLRHGLKTYPRSDVADGSNVKSGNYTVTIADCLGVTVIMDSNAAATFTLPLITGQVDGAIVTLVNNTRGQLLTIDPNNADAISFGDQVADGVTVLNTAATAEQGDYITLVTLSAASTFWNVVAISGTWAVGS